MATEPKKKKATTTPKKSALIQIGAGNGVSKYVKKDSPAGKQAAKAAKAMKLKKAGKKLLRGEELLINKYFNTTKTKETSPKTKKYKKK